MKKTFAHVTDIHLGEPFPTEQGVDQKANWERLLADLKSRNIKTLVFGGDIGEASELAYFTQSLTGFNWSFTLGNHDLDEAGKAKIEPTASQVKEDFLQHDDYEYWVMDSSRERIEPRQLAWLQEAVKTPKKIVLAIHHPILPVPSYIDRRHALEGREAIQSILQQAQNEVTLLCGHYHLEDDRTDGNIRQLLTPAASYLLEKSEDLIIKNDQFGYRLVTLSPLGVTTDVIYLDSQN